jgi:hypothetical protein
MNSLERIFETNTRGIGARPRPKLKVFFGPRLRFRTMFEELDAPVADGWVSLVPLEFVAIV